MLNKTQLKKLTQELNFRLFGIRPQKRIISQGDDYYYCKICKHHFDPEILDKLNRTIHCDKKLILKHSYLQVPDRNYHL